MSTKYFSSFRLSRWLLASLGLVAGTSLAFNPSKFYPDAQVSIYAKNLATGQEVYKLDSDRMMSPASTQKILTALRTFSVFNPQDSFVTRAYATSTPKNGKLSGDLTIVFDGDPSFNASRLRQLISNLKAKGVNEITGNLYINVGKYSGHDYPVGWNASNTSMCFSSENSAAQYNYNCTVRVLDTNGKAGAVAPIKQGKETPLVKINSQVRLVRANESAGCELNYLSPVGLTATLQGCTAITKNGFWLNLAVPNGNIFTAKTVEQQFKASGIKFRSMKLLYAHFNPGRQIELTQVKGESMASLVQTMLHQSENHIAEQLYRGLAYRKTNTQTNYTIAESQNKAVLANLGFDFKYKAVDGSGLSYYNLISAKSMSKVMEYIYKQDAKLNLLKYFPKQDQGTLASHKGLQQFKLLGKTGSLYGVSNLTGILYNQKGQPVVFTYFVNNNINPSKTATQELFEAELFTMLASK